jgi:hypothetical protein
LPPDLPTFTGRGSSLSILDDLLLGVPDTPTTALALLCGSAGIGKTALACTECTADVPSSRTASSTTRKLLRRAMCG